MIPAIRYKKLKMRTHARRKAMKALESMMDYSISSTNMPNVSLSLSKNNILVIAVINKKVLIKK